MATFVWSNVRLFVDEFDLSGQMNKLQLDYTAEMLDATVMSPDKTRLHAPGLWSAEINHNGFLDYADGAIDDQLFATLGVDAGVLQTIVPVPSGALGVIADGDHAFFGEFVSGAYTPGGTVGELAAFNWVASGRTQLAKGRVSIDDAANVTGVANGSAYQFGNAAFGPLGAAIDVPSGDLVKAMVHVTAEDTFTSATIVLESDDVENFGGTPTIVATQAIVPGIASYAFETDGTTAITDDWFRLRVSAFTGTSLTLIGSIGPTRGR
ncbi:hypothetical protein LCGC14_0592350 [marine sediment metagenome]|uniref:Uncharacterized protein n=1 Tax=marine sediment metagenome TaxID=412755 RepID=A0A0F9RWV4_9ZZZZ